MNAPIKSEFSLLHAGVLLALSSMMFSPPVNAACIDNGTGTVTCSGSTGNTNTNAALIGHVELDNSSGPVTLTNSGTDPTLKTGPSDTDLGTLIKNTSNTVGEVNVISATGSNDVIINNIGGYIRLEGIDPSTFIPTRVFNASGWSNTNDGQLLNNGALVGIAAAISSGRSTPSITINNQAINNGVFYTTPIESFLGIPGVIRADGDFSAAIYTSSPLLRLNNTNSIQGNLMSFGGASYTLPTLLDGSQNASINHAGLTVINNNLIGYSTILGDIYIVDRNPLLTLAQKQAQDAGTNLAVAYNVSDVGPRDSVINNSGQIYGNIYLGSGKHLINNTGQIQGNIYVDQAESEAIEVVNGVANPTFKVHGDRSFTFNSTHSNYDPSFGDVVIKDVAGAVNTISYHVPNGTGGAGTFRNNITANGLGNNTLWLDMSSDPVKFQTAGDSSGVIRPRNTHMGNVLGFTNINFDGIMTLEGQYSVVGDININSGHFLLGAYDQPGYTLFSNLTASNVIVANGATLRTHGAPLAVNNLIGTINGNLINNGRIYLGDSTLQVDGNVQLNSGSQLEVEVGLSKLGNINATGTTSVASDSLLIPIVKPHSAVLNGDRYVVATNAGNSPTVVNGNGILKWVADTSSGDLAITANMLMPNRLLPQTNMAGSNALNAFYSYTGLRDEFRDPVTGLQMLLLKDDMRDIDIVRAAERLRPEINDGGIHMLLGNSDKLFNVIDAHLLDAISAKAQDAKIEAELDGKPTVANKGLWVQGFGDRGSQEERKGVDGYGLSSVGMAMGMDKVLDFSDYTRAGLALGYARSNTTNSGDTVNNRIDMNSFMAAAYASRAWDDMYVNGTLGFGRHTYATRRQLFEYNATGTHDSWQFSGKLDAGWPIELNESFTFTPMTSLNYSHIKESGYTENGRVSRMVYNFDDRTDILPQPKLLNGVPQFESINSPINLQVEGRAFDSLRAGIGGKGVYTLQEPDWSAELELHGMLNHEFGDLAQDSNARFVAGGNAFNSPSVQPARDSLIIGGKVNLSSIDENDQLSLITSYDAEIRSKYFGQIVSLAARYDFDQAPRYLKAANARNVALGKQVATQSVQATEKDIAAIQQALQSESSDANNPQSIENTHKLIEINQTLSTWIAALSNKNLEAYFNSYAASFSPNDGSTRQQWERKRKSEITRDANANVKVSYMTVKPHGNQAIAVFTQSTTIGKNQELVQKIVDLENKSGRWLIVREDSVAMTD